MFVELSYKESLSKADALKLLFNNSKDYDLNYKILEGNRTQSDLFKAYQTIIEMSGYDEFNNELRKGCSQIERNFRWFGLQ